MASVSRLQVREYLVDLQDILGWLEEKERTTQPIDSLPTKLELAKQKLTEHLVSFSHLPVPFTHLFWCRRDALNFSHHRTMPKGVFDMTSLLCRVALHCPNLFIVHRFID